MMRKIVNTHSAAQLVNISPSLSSSVVLKYCPKYIYTIIDSSINDLLQKWLKGGYTRFEMQQNPYNLEGGCKIFKI